jgi:hypothetical protein
MDDASNRLHSLSLLYLCHVNTTPFLLLLFSFCLSYVSVGFFAPSFAKTSHSLICVLFLSRSAKSPCRRGYNNHFNISKDKTLHEPVLVICPHPRIAQHRKINNQQPHSPWLRRTAAPPSPPLHSPSPSPPSFWIWSCFLTHSFLNLALCRSHTHSSG